MAEGEDAPRRKCFVIGQIGGDGTEVRNDADWVLIGIIRPALERDPFNYEVTRGDEGPPGQISIQIVEAILDADLIVADLTGYNANAFYELGIAHMAEKPVIHMMRKGNPLPFDNKDYRTLFWDRENPADLDKAVEGLARHADAINEPDFKVSNPITLARSIRNFSESADPKENVIADLVGMVSELKSQIERVEAGRLEDLRTIASESNHPLRLKFQDPKLDAWSRYKAAEMRDHQNQEERVRALYEDQMRRVHEEKRLKEIEAEKARIRGHIDDD